jgi:hypothetical protein
MAIRKIEDTKGVIRIRELNRTDNAITIRKIEDTCTKGVIRIRELNRMDNAMTIRKIEETKGVIRIR